MFYECIIIFFLPQPWLKFVFSFVLQTQWNTSQPEMGLFSTTVSNFFSHFSSKLNHWSLLSILLWTNFGRKIRKEICSSQFFLFFLAARKQFVFNSVNWLVTKIIPVLFFSIVTFCRRKETLVCDNGAPLTGDEIQIFVLFSRRAV